MKYSRKDYIQGICSHGSYYTQFCTQSVISAVKTCIGQERILASTCEHFNDIPLHLWDGLHKHLGLLSGTALGQSNKATYGREELTYSLSDTVCVAKQAAKIIKERAT